MDKNIFKDIDELVISKGYSSRSDFVSRAITELVQREKSGLILVDHADLDTHIESYLRSDTGKKLLRELLQDSG